VGDRQVEEEVPAAGGVLQVVEDLNVSLSRFPSLAVTPNCVRTLCPAPGQEDAADVVQIPLPLTAACDRERKGEVTMTTVPWQLHVLLGLGVIIAQDGCVQHQGS